MNNLLSGGTSFRVINISLKHAGEILAKNNIEVNDRETAIILDFLYHIAQNYNKHEAHKKILTLKRNRTY
jgi:hypothetical protein